jgi:hypothetical protein
VTLSELLRSQRPAVTRGGDVRRGQRPRRRIEHVCEWPAVADAVAKARKRNASDGGPLCDRVRHAVEGDATISAAIVRLAVHRSPHAIARLVIAVVVYAFKRVAHRRPWSHVGKERWERSPSLADRDSAAAVISVGVVGRFQAALTHSQPHDVFRRPALAVGQIDAANLFPCETAAGHLTPALQIVSANYGACSAIAHTLPLRLPAPCVGSASHDAQSSEALTEQIGRLRHMPFYHTKVARYEVCSAWI